MRNLGVLDFSNACYSSLHSALVVSVKFGNVSYGTASYFS